MRSRHAERLLLVLPKMTETQDDGSLLPGPPGETVALASGTAGQLALFALSPCR